MLVGAVTVGTVLVETVTVGTVLVGAVVFVNFRSFQLKQTMYKS